MKGLKGEGVVSGNIQTLAIIVMLVLVVAAVTMVIGGGVRGAASWVGSAYNTVSGNVAAPQGGFTNPFTQGGILRQAYTAVFGQ